MAQKRYFIRFLVLFLSLWILLAIHGCGVVSDLITAIPPALTPTPLPLTLGEHWPELADKQRIVVEGILAYPNSIDGYDLGSYGWRYGLYLADPANGERIGIWFETTSTQERLPNQMESLPSPFRYEDIQVYDNRSKAVYPGDWIRVEGLNNNSNLIVEKVELLRSYPQISHIDDNIVLGDEINLIDIRWYNDEILVIVFESPKEFLGNFHLDLDGNDFTCKDFNDYKLFCSGHGAEFGNEVVINLFHLLFDREDLLHSQDIQIP